MPPPAPVFPVGPPPAPPEAYAVPPVRAGRRERMVIAAIVAVILVPAAVGGILIARLPRDPGGISASTAAPVSTQPSATSPVPTQPNTTAVTPAQTLYGQAIAATRASAGFHYVATSDGPDSQTITGDAGKAGGRQVITVTSSFGSEQFTLMLLKGTVFFQGNRPALEDQLGVAAASAAGLAGRWISVSSADGPYQTLAAGITVSDQASETALRPTSTSSVTNGGTPATRIAGTVPPLQGAPGGTGYLDTSPTTHLPIRYVSTLAASGISVTNTVTFTNWGTAPSVTAPSPNVAWATLGVASPPGGFGGGGGSGPGTGPPTTV